MKTLKEVNFKENCVRIIKNKKRWKIIYAILFSEAIIAFVLFTLKQKWLGVVFTDIFLITFVLENAFEVLEQHKEDVLLKNKITDILLSNQKFVAGLLFWAVEFPLIYTAMNVMTYVAFKRMGLSAVMILDEITGGDWLFLIILVLVWIVNQEIGEKISQYYQERIDQ